jgi:tetratricopeptide (TPR) repeat protein
MKQALKFLQRATEAHRAGNLGVAEKAYSDALQLDPRNADALRLLGSLYIQTHRPAEGEDYLRRALARQPQNPEIHNNLALGLRHLGRLDEARRHYERAVALKPDYVQALGNLALTYTELNRPDEALTTFRRALTLDDRNAKTHYALANLLRGRSGGLPEAIRHYETALRLKPDYFEAMVNLGIAYIENGDTPRAIAWYQGSLKADPGNVRIMNNLGNALRSVGRSAEAHDLFLKALALAPQYAEAHVNCGAMYRDLGRFAEAEAECHRALALNPKLVAAKVNLATLYQDQRRHEEALATFDEALAAAPDLPEAQWNKSLSLLALGRFDEGWPLYEKGLGHYHLRMINHAPDKRWDGVLRPGLRLLLWAEQGLGDSLQFVRYAQLCHQAGLHVTVFAQPGLRRLFRACPAIDDVPDALDPEAYDANISLMSLPYAFQTRLDTIPNEVPYLFVSDEARATWAPLLAAHPGPKIGLVWAGNPREHMANAHLLDRRRSLPLEAFRPLLTREDVTFISLQKGDKAAQIAEQGLTDRLIDPMNKVQDFMDTAAIVEGLDLVITVDTSVAHLAGALGKPVWILSRYDACWRWLCNQETNPWYPTARLFGQDAPGDWPSALARVATALCEERFEKQ